MGFKAASPIGAVHRIRKLLMSNSGTMPAATMRTDLDHDKTHAPGAALVDDHHVDGVPRLDRMAIGLSVVCLLHCLALPVFLLALPTLSDYTAGTESPFHWLLLGIALPLSGFALWRGYLHHRHRNVLLLGGLGLTIMFLGVAHLPAEQFETPLTVVGVVVLLAAHVVNLRQNANCSHAH